MIEEAFSKWKSYIEYKGVMKGYETTPQIALDLNRQSMERCDGTEDLKFYLGVKDDEVREAKMAYNNPVAFAHRSRYDVSRGWGKGFIWIARPHTVLGGAYPEWQQTPDKLLAFLMHELGHVLGNTHIQSTIMDEDIAELVLIGFTDSKNFRRIDWGSELAENRYHHPLVGRMSVDTKNTGTSESFKRIVGRDLVGDVKVVLRNDLGWSGLVELIFEDSQGSKGVRVNISGGNTGAFIRIPNPIFKRACTGTGCTGAAYQRLRAGYSVGTVTASDNTVLPAFIEFNLGRSSSQVDAPVSIKYWENGKNHELFAQTELQ
jgi:hypothetical protein